MTVVPPKVEPPREPSRDQKRSILRKLDESYDEARKCYIQGMADQVIASGLNVPRAWVVDLREEFYGPSGDNEEARRIRTEIDAIKSVLGEAERAMDKAVTALSDATTKMQAIEKRQEALAKQLG